MLFEIAHNSHSASVLIVSGILFIAPVEENILGVAHQVGIVLISNPLGDSHSVTSIILLLITFVTFEIVRFCMFTVSFDNFCDKSSCEVIFCIS